MEFLSRRGWSVAVALVLGFGVTAAAWAAPSVKSVETQPASRPLAIGELAHKLEPFAADARLKGMKFGLCIIDVAGGEKIFASTKADVGVLQQCA